MSVHVTSDLLHPPLAAERRSGLPPLVWAMALILVLTVLLIWQLSQ